MTDAVSGKKPLPVMHSLQVETLSPKRLDLAASFELSCSLSNSSMQARSDPKSTFKS